MRLKIGLTTVVPQTGSRWFPTFSSFDDFATVVPERKMGTRVGNQYGNAKSFGMCFSATVVPKRKMGTTMGTTVEPQMP